MPSFYPIAIQIEGRTHRGQWTLKQGARVSVGGFYGARTVELGDAHPANLAAQVLAELVADWAARNQPPAREPAKPIVPRTVVKVAINGRDWNGSWTLLGGQVFVYSAYGQKTAAVKRAKPELVAQRLLKALVTEWLTSP